ncbi:ribonuclease H-like protein [Exidia glandulosa HHB12029]|uniref:3'-5' exonuclease n=1 Tax=Exidia glandulosa HHB12029 TaxID=1314781 RepID=A0A165B2G4_EXIGL|nr:ribonuclease H-like protein [Exidia glandulosa HHB12029]
MNLSPKRIPSGGYAARIISALDAEFAQPHLSPPRYVQPARPSQRRFYSPAPHATTSDRPKLHPFILQREPTAPVILQPSNATKSQYVSDMAAARAMQTAQRDREKAAFRAMKNYDCKEVQETAPAIVYSRDEEEIDELIGTLNGPLGFDLEWRPNFVKNGKEHKTATIQICDSRIIIIAQISALGVPQNLKKVLEDKEIAKCGLNILNDGQKLYRDYGVVAKGLVELGTMASQADQSSNHLGRPSLGTLVGRYLKRNLLKGSVRMSNWEAQLDANQVKYAANDAYCGLALYNHFVALAEENDRTLKPTQYTVNVNPPPKATSLLPPSAASTSRASMTASTSSRMDVDEDGSVTTTTTKRARTTSTTKTATDKPSIRPSYLRAYTLWRESNMPLDDLCGALRTPDNPLKRSTVISYLVEAVRTDTSLPYERSVLLEMVNMDAYAQKRYRSWIKSVSSS